MLHDAIFRRSFHECYTKGNTWVQYIIMQSNAYHVDILYITISPWVSCLTPHIQSGTTQWNTARYIT